MPVSKIEIIPEVIGMVRNAMPKKVIDIGVGFGKYGVLCREVLDIKFGRYHRSEWKTRIDGIEVFGEYITPYHKYIYNKIIIGNVMETHVKGYDVVLLCDVIEHLEHGKGVELLDRLVRGNGFIIVTTPSVFRTSEPYKGNEHERHLSVWKAGDFGRWDSMVKEKSATLIAYIHGMNH